MRAGDVIVNVPDRLKATVSDYHGNNVFTFHVEEKDEETGREGWYNYTGRVNELFKHLADHMAFYNRHVSMFGGKPF
jgi:hypothetical protein